MFNTIRSDRFNEMAKQKEYIVCIGCQKELQLKVKFCPFCSAPQSVQASNLPVMPEVTPTTSKGAQSEIPTPIVTQIPSEEPKNEAPVSVVIKHITKKGKELSGTIVVGSTLELMRNYDPYAFKKDEGVFVRLEHLAKIPNEYLSVEQCQLKLQSDSFIQDPDTDESLEQPQPVAAAPTPAPTPIPTQATPLDTPKPKTSSFKYIAIGFVLLLVVVFFMFSGQDHEEEPVYVDEGTQVDPCENANAEINSLLSEKMPTRALTIIRLHQEECKTNAGFVQLVVSAEAQTASAKDKLALTKEYLEAGDLDSSHRMLLSALEHDVELVGSTELLARIETMIEEFNYQQEQEQIVELVEVAIESEEDSEITQNVQQKAMHQQAEQAQRLAQVEREHAEAQRQAELAQRQADQAHKERQQVLERERQKAEEAARKQSAEAARRQNEERFEGLLNRAERALNSNNYGLAKSLAREVLSISPNNVQAKRILRQAEAGEAAAFDEMIIQ